MKFINQNFINGSFVEILGSEVAEFRNPTTNEPIIQLKLSNLQDAQNAIDAASTAFATFSQTTVKERMFFLQRIYDAIIEKVDSLTEATVEEYGATEQRALWSSRYAADCFLYFQKVLETFEFERKIGESKVILEPIGVTVILTSWSSSAGSICVKLAAAIAGGCTTVIKPSEMSSLQTQILMECFNTAELPAGVINVINGTGAVLGEILSTHPKIAKINFTGSTEVGKIIARNASNTIKRLTLELSGKSPNIILDDAYLETAIPMAVECCFQNNGQSCIAGSRLIVPEKLLPEVERLVIKKIETMKVGDPRNPKNVIGPLASEKQYDRIQYYIRSGIVSGARLLIGGEGKPEGLIQGNFVRPTVFTGVTSNMAIAREEIFGPVLSILSFRTDDQAIQIANDTIYGLHAYVSSTNIKRAENIAKQINAGRVAINVLKHDPYSPFGGFKESGIGREGGIYGLEEQLEPKVMLM